MRLWREVFWEPHGSVFFFKSRHFLTFHVMRKDVFAQNFQCVEFFLRWNFQSQTARGRERGGCVFQKSALGFSNATQTSATQGEVPQKVVMQPTVGKKTPPISGHHFRWFLVREPVSIELNVMPRSPPKKQVANITQKGCVVEDKLDVRPGWILAATGTLKKWPFFFEKTQVSIFIFWN